MENDEKRMADTYEITNSFWVNGKEICFGIDDHKDMPYLVSDCVPHPLLGGDVYVNAVICDDYLEALEMFNSRIYEGIQKVKEIRRERGITNTLKAGDCIQGSSQGNYEGKVLVVRAGILQRDKKTADYQLIYAEHGNGCSPDARGLSIFARELYGGTKVRYSRADITGIIKPERIPEWAKANIEKMEKKKAAKEPER